MPEKTIYIPISEDKKDLIAYSSLIVATRYEDDDVIIAQYQLVRTGKVRNQTIVVWDKKKG